MIAAERRYIAAAFVGDLTDESTDWPCRGTPNLTNSWGGGRFHGGPQQ